MKNRRRTFRILAFSLLGAAVLLALGSVVASKYAFKKIDSQLRDAGIIVQGIQVNLFSRSITIDGFDWQSSRGRDSASTWPDSSYTHVTARQISARAIAIIDLIKNKEINIGSIHLSEVRINANRIEKLKGDSAQSAPTKIPFNKITVDRILIDDLGWQIRHDTLIEHSGNANLAIHDIILTDPQNFKDPQAYSAGNFRAQLDHYHMEAQKSMYKLNIRRLVLDSKEKEFIADSIVLIPRYGKYEFSRRVGKQIDRFILRTPKVAITGLDLSRVRDSIITASRLEINNTNLHVFRDKRLPFIKDHNTPLPVAMIRTLPFGFAIDTIALNDTNITYEEFPEKGFETGYIIFDELNARLDHITNRPLYPGVRQAVLRVNSHVMKNGIIKVDFTLPYDEPQLYNAKGRISNLSLPGLNSMFESLAFVRIESGRLNALDFDFDYNDIASEGNLVLNYENLKLAGLKKEKDAEVNELKSLVLNVFVKTDKDRDVPIEKRTGKISYERDRRRAIFNVWVKSLMSGVKSSVVDSETERKPLTRKERRDSLRQVRRDVRAQEKRKN